MENTEIKLSSVIVKNDFLSRKFILVIIIIGISTGFIIFGAMNILQWIELVKWVFLGYVGGNVGEKFLEGKNGDIVK